MDAVLGIVIGAFGALLVKGFIDDWWLVKIRAEECWRRLRGQ